MTIRHDAINPHSGADEKAFESFMTQISLFRFSQKITRDLPDPPKPISRSNR
jgi:hypothetical protein